MRHSHLAVLLALTCLTLPASARTPTVSEIHAFRAAHGTWATLARYFDRGISGRDGGYRLVESGSSEGVALGVEMIKDNPGAVSTGESLLDALGTAMMHNPRAVLPLLDSDRDGPHLLDAAHLCAPFIGDDLSEAKALAILARSRRAIAAVHDRALQGPRAACLTEIALGVENVRRYYRTPK